LGKRTITKSKYYYKTTEAGEVYIVKEVYLI